jgi:transmembrane sensor
MRNYSNIDAGNLAHDVDFIKWVVQEESRDENYDSAIKNWLAEYPEKIGLVEEARKIVLAIYSERQFHFDDSQEDVLWSRIEQSTHSQRRTRSRSVVPYAVAALVAVIVTGTLGWKLWSPKNDQFPGAHYIVFSNKGSKSHAVVLEDGSVVVLQAHSTIRYPESFSESERNVYLVGEAFFNVTKDAAKPFSVFANNVVTRVLGTSFNVRAYEDEANVVVAVKTGKVSVFQDSKSVLTTDSLQYLNGVLLTPNQQITVFKKELRMLKSIVDKPMLVDSTMKEDFLFNDTPIREVFRRLEKAYGVKIVYEEEILANCLLNTSLKDVAFYDQLRMICRGINAEFEIVDANVIVKGGGCD